MYQLDVVKLLGQLLEESIPEFCGEEPVAVCRGNVPVKIT